MYILPALPYRWEAAVLSYYAERHPSAPSLRDWIIAVAIMVVVVLAVLTVTAIIHRHQDNQRREAEDARNERIRNLIVQYVTAVNNHRKAQKRLKSQAAQNELRQCRRALDRVDMYELPFATDKALDLAARDLTTAEYRLRLAERYETDPNAPVTKYMLGEETLRSDDTTEEPRAEAPE